MVEKSWQSNLIESLQKDNQNRRDTALKSIADIVPHRLMDQIKEAVDAATLHKGDVFAHFEPEEEPVIEKPKKKDKRTKIEVLMDQINEAIDIVRKENATSWSAGYQTEWNRGAQSGASSVSVELHKIIKRDAKLRGR